MPTRPGLTRPRQGGNPGFPAAGPMLVKDHSESGIRVDPATPEHLIGSVKWLASAEGYHHVPGFDESFNGGKTWATGHIPGYEGGPTTPTRSPRLTGSATTSSSWPTSSFTTRTAPTTSPWAPRWSPTCPARGSGGGRGRPPWSDVGDSITTHDGHPDFVATYDSVGNEPDKQWLTIDDNPASPFYYGIYAMWVDFPLPHPRFRSAPMPTPGPTRRTPTGRCRSRCPSRRTWSAQPTVTGSKGDAWHTWTGWPTRAARRRAACAELCPCRCEPRRRGGLVRHPDGRATGHAGKAGLTWVPGNNLRTRPASCVNDLGEFRQPGVPQWRSNIGFGSRSQPETCRPPWTRCSCCCFQAAIAGRWTSS